jgi:hypothetical protein
LFLPFLDSCKSNPTGLDRESTSSYCSYDSAYLKKLWKLFLSFQQGLKNIGPINFTYVGEENGKTT